MASEKQSGAGYGDHFPNSTKIYKTGERDGVRVPFRKITLSPAEANQEAYIYVYDTSGPWTDPAMEPDVRQGLPRLRHDWIDERNDSETYEVASRLDPERRKSGRDSTSFLAGASTRRRARPGNNVTQMHYARRGIITPEMEYIAIRENLGLTLRKNLPAKPAGTPATRRGRVSPT